ncbi:glycosyltransferase [Parafilimonas sp.]|uniref:glycosyltransferase n=1 Tax=Parafilimonas sp. TaxID=1969739 RepID=UPI0039E66C7D
MMSVVHITEAFEAGVLEFLRCLTGSLPDVQHTIVYGRHHIYDKAGKTFPSSITFIAWPEVNTNISPRSDLSALRHLIKILKNMQQVDIIHLHSAKAGILGRIAARQTNHKKVIYTPHGASFLRKDVPALARAAFAAVEKAASIFPARVVGVSRSEADAYKQIGIRASYVNNGKSFPQSPPKKAPGNTFTVVTTARAMRQKNPALFNTIASAFTDNDRIKFVWIGDGGERYMLSSPNITITGWLEKTEVEKKLLAGDLYISTALWEGLSYAVLEAMSMRLPLLLTGCPGNKDLVENGLNGFLFSYPAQAIDFINQYVNNHELLLAHGEASYNLLQSNFSIDQMAQGYREVYASM